MTPGRLYLFTILCLVLAGLLLFTSDTGLANTLGALVLALALVAYLLGLYLARIGRRGEAALGELQQRISQATGRSIHGEFRGYHLEGLEGVPAGELLLFYRTERGWLLVPLLEELSWIEVPGAGVGAVELEERGEGLEVGLRVELETESGRELRLSLSSTQIDPSRQTLENVEDLHALKDALQGNDLPR